jgi:hypothetical protein
MGFFRGAPDTDFAGYPANLKAGYCISTFYCVVKYEINQKQMY